jgi:hypothetical protein
LALPAPPVACPPAMPPTAVEPLPGPVDGEALLSAPVVPPLPDVAGAATIDAALDGAVALAALADATPAGFAIGVAAGTVAGTLGKGVASPVVFSQADRAHTTARTPAAQTVVFGVFMDVSR